MFRTILLSIIRSFSLYTQQWCMSYRHADSLWAVSKLVWPIPLLCVQWKTPDDGQKNCPRHVEFYSKKKCEKSVHLIGFIIRIYHDARSYECQAVHVEMNLIETCASKNKQRNVWPRYETTIKRCARVQYKSRLGVWNVLFCTTNCFLLHH